MDRLTVRFLTGTRAGEERAFSLAEISAGITLGRDPTASIEFSANDEVVSRMHARVEPHVGAVDSFWLIDLGSSNGVYINGARLESRARFEHGDVIRLGGSGPEMMFKADPVPALASEAPHLIEAPPHDPLPRAVVGSPTAVAVATLVVPPPPNPLSNPLSNPLPHPHPNPPQGAGESVLPNAATGLANRGQPAQLQTPGAVEPAGNQLPRRPDDDRP